jgi:hypothetical protein
MTKPKRPRDPNQLAKLIVGIATGEVEEAPTAKNTAAVARGQKDGLKGGKARMAKLSDDQKTDLAKKAAAARWKKQGAPGTS